MLAAEMDIRNRAKVMDSQMSLKRELQQLPKAKEKASGQQRDREIPG